MKPLRALTVAATVLAWDSGVAAPPLTLDVANRAALAAVAHCAKDGYRVSAAVVDRGGTLLALTRSESAGPHTADSSRKKAYTAMSIGESTAKLASLIADKQELQALRDVNDSILILGGGLPARAQGAVIGGIGVGGAPGAHLDEACARAGLDVIEKGLAVPSSE